jgi:chromosome segregation and condensation protein ScpB
MIKNKLEALLFSSGRKMSTEELSKLCNSKNDEIQSALVELKQDYDDKNSSLMFVNEGDYCNRN